MVTSNIIDKFAFGSSSDAADVANLTIARHRGGGCTSSTHGYHIGGHNNGTSYDRIDKYQYSSDANATDVGDALAADTRYVGTEDDDTFGYLQGRTGDTTQVARFSFSTDGDAVDVGNLNRDGTEGGGCTSLTFGYNYRSQTAADDIQKHDFSTSITMTDVGELSVSRLEGSTGSQG